MIETHVTAMLARFAAELRFEDLPAETVEHIKIYLADWFAASFAGEKVNGAYNCAVREILFDMGGKEEASVMFSDRRLPVMHAAFLHATLAHGADMDDGNRKAMGHVGAHVMSTALALSETLPGVTGQDLVTAITVGYEVYNRVAAAAQDWSKEASIPREPPARSPALPLPRSSWGLTRREFMPPCPPPPYRHRD